MFIGILILTSFEGLQTHGPDVITKTLAQAANLHQKGTHLTDPESLPLLLHKDVLKLMAIEIYTVGHSTQPFEKFLGLLKKQGVTAIAHSNFGHSDQELPNISAPLLSAFCPVKP